MAMKIEEIEARFKEVTGVTQEIGRWPLDTNLESIEFGELTSSPHFFQFPVRKELSKSHGEVFTPLLLCDKMILHSAPSPQAFNLDLCSGRGQFTVRILRMFHEAGDFDIDSYLREWHWFNEMNPESCKELLYIFGENINLACGPAQELKKYPEEEGVWKKGVWRWENGWRKGLESTSALF